MTHGCRAAEVELTAGGYRAVVREAGATLVALEHEGLPLIDGPGPGELPEAGHGQVLAPWPNRLRDGRWTWRGVEHQLPVDTPEKGNSASHGLVRWSAWQILSRERRRVLLTHHLSPRPGYPFALHLDCEYQLTADGGLAVRLTARNAGIRPAPVALGAHPYLVPAGSLEDAVLTVPAATVLRADAEGVPVAREPVRPAELDLRRGRRIDGLMLNHTFGDLDSEDGRVRCTLAEGGRELELWAGEGCRWLQVYTGDGLSPKRHRRAVAVEPMSAPPQALATGLDLAVLSSGESFTLRWGLRLR